jgi:hypothetical protein
VNPIPLPDLGEQLSTRDNASLPTRQDDEYRILAWGEEDRHVPAHNRVRGEVDLEVAQAYGVAWLAPSGPSYEGADASNELGRRARPLRAGVGSCLHAADDRAIIAGGRKSNDVTGMPTFTELTDCGHSVRRCRYDVQNDDIGRTEAHTITARRSRIVHRKAGSLQCVTPRDRLPVVAAQHHHQRSR